MSEYTTQGTEFEQGSCRTCGSDSYGMLSDGPRCYGCKRFVLKDTGIDCGPGRIRHLAFRGPLTLEALDETTDALSSGIRYAVYERTRRISEEFDRACFGYAPMLSEGRRRRTWHTPKRWQGRRAPLKAADALTEAEVILKEART